MSSPRYRPKHDQPFTLTDAVDLDVGILSNEITRLRNSVEHLRASNQELDTFVKDPENADDTEGLEDVIKENEQVIEVQEDRIELLKHALEQKIGSDPANKHYDSGPTAASPQPLNESATTQRTDATPVGDTEETPAAEDEGMYL